MAEKNDSPTTIAGTGKGSTPARRHAAYHVWMRFKRRPIRNSAITIGVLTTVVVLGYLMKFLVPAEYTHSTTRALLVEALAALDEGRLDDARNAAAELRLHDDIPDEDRGVPPYVLGVVAYRDALRVEQERERGAWFLLASRYLEEALAVRFPFGRSDEGILLLGKSLHACGRYSEAAKRLEEALPENPEYTTDICQLLTDSLLHEKVPNLEKAFEYNKRCLADESLSRTARDEFSLIQARIAFDLGRSAECQEILQQFPENSPSSVEASLLAGRLLLQEGDAILAENATTNDRATSDDARQQQAAAAKYSAAEALFAKALQRSSRNNTALRQAKYLLGLAHRRLGDIPTAIKDFERTRRNHFETPEGIAAGLEEGELHHQQGNDQDALTAFNATLRAAAAAKNFGNPWTNADDIRRRIEAVYYNYRRDERFSQAVELVDSLYVLFPDSRSVDMQANSRQSWAEHLARQVEGQSQEADGKLITQSRSEHRQAGHLFEKLARMRFATREYADALWSSAENYLNGQDYDSAVRMYRRCLNNQQVGKAAAFVRLGEAHLALNDPEEALAQVQHCIEDFSKDPFVYRARLVAARANLQLDRLGPAKDLMFANLENGSLTPQSREWRESLFLLGRVYFREGMHHETQSRIKGIDRSGQVGRQEGMKELQKAQIAFRECAKRLSEAVQREPDAPEAIPTRYMLAQAHLQSAKLPKKELLQANIETTRVLLRREMNRELFAAAAAFEDLKSRLIAKQEKGELTAVESNILRNCYFGRADALFDLEHYEEAIQAYTSATSQYQNQPESLEAYVQIANCHRKLNRPADSRRMLDQARHVLDRIQPNADFHSTTRYDRQEWSDLLMWLREL